jgi:lactoylglutathione lyase
MEAMMKALFLTAAPYADDAMNLPVDDIDAAIPYYEKSFGFRVVSRQDAPHKSVVLARDQVQIGLAENGGDPTQEGCVFEVDNLEAAFAEIKGVPAADSDFRHDSFDGVPVRVFFVVAPDGLCFMLAQREK